MSNIHIGKQEDFKLVKRDLVQLVQYYYEKRALKHPNIWEALGWATAELGEVYEVLMSMSGGWVRNNPEDHPIKNKEDLAEELGDVIFMIIVAGLEEGVDPIKAMENKMLRKLSDDKRITTSHEMKETTPEEFLGEKDGN